MNDKLIEEMTKDMYNDVSNIFEEEYEKRKLITPSFCTNKLLDLGYRKIPQDSVVLTREEYEKLKSLYDAQKGAIMTSSIGDLPLTIDGLRKAVDEITRLITVQTELQELNAKYYNEAKDLRRKLKEANNETAKYLIDEFATMVVALKVGKILNKKLDNPVSKGAYLFMINGIKELAQQYGVEIGE